MGSLTVRDFKKRPTLDRPTSSTDVRHDGDGAEKRQEREGRMSNYQFLYLPPGLSSRALAATVSMDVEGSFL
jgi:hypothetical protein